MTISVSTSKKPRKQHTPEFRNEALKLAERIGVAAAAGDIHRSIERLTCSVKVVVLMRSQAFHYLMMRLQIPQRLNVTIKHACRIDHRDS